MTDIVQIGIISAILVGTIILAYLITLVLPKRSYLPDNLIGQDNFHKMLALLIVIALADFYFVSFIPVVKRFNNPAIEFVVLGIFLVLSLVSIIICIEIREVILDINISLINRNLQFLQYSIRLILMQGIVVALFYLNGLITLMLGIDTLPGIAFIFEIQESEISDLNLITDSLPLISVLTLAGIKGAFLLLHHGSIIIVFVTLYVIFEEWSGRTRETSINYFKIFTLGFVIQGMGQVIQSIGIIYASHVITLSNEIPAFISLPITLGSFIVLIGAIIYFISFMLAALSLLGNISHMLVPRKMLAFYKIAVIVFPIIYGILYSLLFLMNLSWFFGIGGSSAEDLAKTLETATHLLDLPAMILLPLGCGLFFLVAYRQSHEKKKGMQLSNYVLWTFMSLFLIFGVGNNTMSAVSWFGMLHGPLTLLGSIVLLYGLSRVADHASRFRQVIKHIRESPDDFIFLAKLGEAERKIQIWAKVESLVKSDIIKPLVPTKTPLDETKAAAEIRSYMDEINAQYKRLQKRPTVPA